MVCISAAGISTIYRCTTTISTAIARAQETGTVKMSAVEITGISLFKKRAVMRVVPIIPIVAVPGREVVIRIAGKLVLIGHAIAAWIAVRVGIRVLVVIRFLINRRRRGVDYRRRCYINAGPR
jgi:hypothetical protein